MEMATQNLVRAQYIKSILDHLSATEDVALIASNTLNFPVAYNGEEAWVEVTVKIPKDDDGDAGYLKRKSYTMHLQEKADKAKAQEEAKAKKVAADKAKRKKKKDNEQKEGE